MSTQRSGWARDPYRGAGGRRRYNALRQFCVKLRRAKILQLMLEENLSFLTRGTQARLAEALGVSESTISRDLKALFAGGLFAPAGVRCFACGARPLADTTTTAMAERLKALDAL